MKPEEYQGIAALVIALGTAIGGIISSRHASKKEQEKVETAPVAIVQPTPVALPATPSEQQRFIESILSRLEAVEASNIRLEKTVGDMREELEFFHKREETFTSALGRWLGRIARDYANRGQQMPLPEPDDMVVLKDIIPRG